MPRTSRRINNLVALSEPDVHIAQPLHSGPAKRPRQRSGSTSDTQTAVPCPRPRPRSSKSSTTAAHLPSTLARHQPMDHLSEEEIIINNPSSSGTESSDGLLHHRSRRHEAEADDAMQLNSSTDLLCNFEEQEKVPSTADIRHFFDRTSEETVCKYCK
ncbi:hypothetical protein PAXINDRAFT_15341 [Paxillus involutus ATCC 200175]|uniref:Uncharacterized protein n=1 Tax=Paxillus involutus ATCC 200175 TaxID=664439 RepID=A0A0C9TMF2_PAXIN|nr:hypothetical protein PAXINDRAFT_15341 [Paxillus involutus ATCC 200175]